MKTGKSLVELAQEISRIKETAKDYIVPTEKLKAEVVATETKNGQKDELVLSFQNGVKHDLRLNSWSAGQLASYADIPKQYFDRITAENPKLAASNINHGFEKNIEQARREGRGESRMLRTLDGNVRGLLSSRYRILDAHDMLETVLPVMMDKGMTIASSEVTDKRLFVKALSPSLIGEVSKGDVVQYGLTISTSDVGAGSVRVEPLIYRLVCKNGMISNTAIRKYHVGKNQAENDIHELLSDRTKELTDAAFWAQVRDIVLASMKPENFELQMDKLRVAAGEPIKNFDLPRVVELTMRATGINGEAKKNSILSALASGNEGAGLTKWGLVNSFTRAAQSDDLSYEESIDMERAGGLILELPKSQWSTIAAVA
jgi:hypothetical protein